MDIISLLLYWLLYFSMFMAGRALGRLEINMKEYKKGREYGRLFAFNDIWDVIIQAYNEGKPEETALRIREYIRNESKEWLENDRKKNHRSRTDKKAGRITGKNRNS